MNKKSNVQLMDKKQPAQTKAKRPIDDGVQMYLKSIGEIRLLTPKEEIELAEKVAMGDPEAKNQMMEHNLRLVVNVAKRYNNKGNC